MKLNPITFIVLLIGVSLLTYLTRLLPIIYLSKKELPTWLISIFLPILNILL